ncbi:hypothetical protein OG21DRAFT_1505737 [Imleria badia]|nr:hypothetical protein OG21DRAFT_1505737 [Imleria badia]
MNVHFEELHKPSTLVAIDAEFVSMQQAGSHSTRLVHLLNHVLLFLKKKQSSGPTVRPVSCALLVSVLARVSVLRGDGLKEGIPFIDDHVLTSDVIVDYLHRVLGYQIRSGIRTCQGTRSS